MIIKHATKIHPGFCQFVTKLLLLSVISFWMIYHGYRAVSKLNFTEIFIFTDLFVLINVNGITTKYTTFCFRIIVRPSLFFLGSIKF